MSHNDEHWNHMYTEAPVSHWGGLASREAGSLPKPQVLGKVTIQAFTGCFATLEFINTLRQDQLVAITLDESDYVVWYRELISGT